MEVCVQKGMDIATATGDPFVWLTSTNYGASEVSRAALRCLDVHAYSVIRMMRMKGFTQDLFQAASKIIFLFPFFDFFVSWPFHED